MYKKLLYIGNNRPRGYCSLKIPAKYFNEAGNFVPILK